MLTYIVRRTSFLMHYGVKGMKWGIRRYQDYNGRRIGTNAAVKREHAAAVKRMNDVHTSTGDPEVDKEIDDYFKGAGEKHPIEKLSEIARQDSDSKIEKLRFQINSDEDEGWGRYYNCPNCAAAFEMTERGYSVTAREKKDGSNVENIESFFKDGKLKTCDGAESVMERYGLIRLGQKATEAAKSSDDYQASIKKQYTGDQLRDLAKTNPKLLDKIDETMSDLIDKKLESSRNYWNAMNDACDEVRDRTLSELKNQGNGARGVMAVGWALTTDNPSERTNSYHAFNYKVENGEVNFYDAQSHRKEKINGGVGTSFFRDADPRDVYYMRTDNLELSENITQAVYSNNRKGK